MKRADLEHILRASKSATGEAEFIIVGSQSILGRHPDAPRVLRQSMELDIYPKHRPELAPDIDGSLESFRSSTRPSATTRMASARRRRHCPRAGRSGW